MHTTSLLQLIDNAIGFVSNARDGSNAIAPISSFNSSFYNIDEDELTCLDLDQTEQFKNDGFCALNGPDPKLNCAQRSRFSLIVRGYMRRNYDPEAHFEDGVVLLLIEYYHSRCINERLLVQFALTLPNRSETSRQVAQFKKDDSSNSSIALIVRGYVKRNYDSEAQLENKVILLIAEYYPDTILIPRRCALLSSVMCAKMDSVPMSAAAIDLNDDLEEDEKLPWEPMQKVFRYLAHHNGKEPDPLPCPVRSIHMSQIVSDQWDATFIDAFEKKEIFEIILCARTLGIQSLLHLGCTKIATLIKQLDQQEINRIIEEEERYRREQAAVRPADDAVEADEDEETKNDDKEEEEEVMALNANDENDDDEDDEFADLAELLSNENEEVKIVNEAEEEVFDFQQVAALNDENDEDETADTEELQSNLNCSDLETSSDQNFKEMRELTAENQSGAVSEGEALAVEFEEEHVAEQE